MAAVTQLPPHSHTTSVPLEHGCQPQSKPFVSAISGHTLEKARKELGEIPEKRSEFIRKLRVRIEEYERNANDEDVVLVRRDDKFLLMFLRARKFDVNRAFQLYYNYYKYRHKYAYMLHDYNPKSVERILHSGVFGVLDSRLKNGSKVLCIWPSRYNIDEIPVSEMFKTLMLILDRLIEDEESQVHGLSLFENLEGLSFYHVMKIASTEHVQKAIVIELIQEAFPARFKSAHIIKQPWYVSIVFRIVRPFLKQKMRDRIHMYGSDFSALYDYIDPQCLSSDFGGYLPAVEQSSVAKLFERELSS